MILKRHMPLKQQRPTGITRLANNETGFATLIVATTLVVILSLLTVGFAQLMRREEDQALNRQLSNQANYAAEAGINDALRALDAGWNKAKTTCGPITSLTGAAGETYLTSNNVDASGSATQWSCLLIDPSPGSLEYSPVDTVTPSIFTVNTVQSDRVTPTAISTIKVSWKDADPLAAPQFWSQSGTFDNAAFPPAGASGWNKIGMVRVSITPLVGALSRSNLTQSTVTAFLYPTTSSANNSMTVNFGSMNPAGQGQLLDGGCSAATKTCSATINFSPSLPVGTPLLISLRSIYAKTHVYMTTDSGSYFSGAQALVDSTGRAQDVLKRIQVRVPIKSHYDLPGFVVDSIGGICKQLSVYPGFADGCSY
ncbi:MAG TPA: pilus assembly PilX N-terminal domain-containing protein [Patescibacteria group bacterium]|nr:pilus assembly PilX N-terminal domain-containing protein [Patescibacteria group bacterium]